MSKTALAALIGIGGALMIFKGVSGGSGLDLGSYFGGKSKEKDVDPSLRDKTEDEWRAWQQRLRDLGFKAPDTGKYDEGTQKAVKDFERVHGLEIDGVWDDELEEAIIEEMEYLEKNGMPNWFNNQISEQGYQSLDDFERLGKRYYEEGVIGEFDPQSLAIKDTVEKYWDEGLPGPQFITYSDDEKKIIAGPDHLLMLSEIVLEVIYKYSPTMPSSSWLDAYEARYTDQGLYTESIHAASSYITGPIGGAVRLVERLQKYWHEAELADQTSWYNAKNTAYIQSLQKIAMRQPLMFYKGSQMETEDFEVDSTAKAIAVAEYVLLVGELTTRLARAFAEVKPDGQKYLTEDEVKPVIISVAQGKGKHIKILQGR